MTAGRGASIVIPVCNGAPTVGPLVGRLIDRFGYYRILPAAFVLIALATWTVGIAVTAPVGIVILCIAVVGFFAGGSNSGLMALASNSYPVAIRSTGVGAAYSLGMPALRGHCTRTSVGSGQG